MWIGQRKRFVLSTRKLASLLPAKSNASLTGKKLFAGSLLIGKLLKSIIVKRKCERCNQEARLKLVRNIAANGTSQVYWLCLSCNEPAKKNGYFIPHEILKQNKYDPNLLPVINNYSGSNLCEVCQSPFAELHHWAPKHLFGNEQSEEYPKSYLCKYHHEHWHKIATPNMDKRYGIQNRSVFTKT